VWVGVEEEEEEGGGGSLAPRGRGSSRPALTRFVCLVNVGGNLVPLRRAMRALLLTRPKVPAPVTGARAPRPPSLVLQAPTVGLASAVATALGRPGPFNLILNGENLLQVSLAPPKSGARGGVLPRTPHFSATQPGAGVQDAMWVPRLGGDTHTHAP
jgi:hypothetical protein